MARLASLALLTALLSHPAAAASRAAPVCPPRTVPVTVDLEFQEAVPVYDNRKNLDWIAREARTNRRTGNPVGLTTTRLYHRLDAHFQTENDLSGRSHCTTLVKVRLLMGYTETVVHIASKYAPGSCQYWTIHHHEADHVRILNLIRQRFLPRIQRTMAVFANRIPIHHGDRPKRDQRRILKRLDRSARIIEKTMARALNRAHAAIDTPQNYARIRAQCPKW